MGLTIHWRLQGPKTKAEAKTIIERMRQRALDLPFESVSDIVHFKGKEAQFDNDPPTVSIRWLKIMAGQTVWSKDGRTGWDCPAREILGFQVIVAPGSEWMEIYLAAYPKTMIVEEDWGSGGAFPPTCPRGSGRGFCKTQYASNADCGGVPNFLRAHLSVCRLLDHAKKLGILADVSRRGPFFENRDIPALVNTVADWNEFIAAGVGATDRVDRQQVRGTDQGLPRFRASGSGKGQKQIDKFLRAIKGLTPKAGQ